MTAEDRIPEENGTVIAEPAGDAVVLRVTGELDLATAPKLQRKVDGALREGPPAVLVIDLSGVTFLASAGMAVLVAAHRGSGERTRVRVVAASRVTLRPLELTKLTTELAVYPTTEQAMAG
ncbi:STAS domain-containing protein [Amycolatopsis acidiphila]|uniref:Anti-sigma factor antagonist n=1 Tax=Amycolatopsis acidiphila TaxID=715473 RepID=A0A558ACM2_9PSEU|nr:STAS domain-containing protein [Amycolatopsis acidiphila]TVT22014.1 STAS domain-containing protein [Amycolatopsis acidiphila]UIJ63670.1 STAS domain-containing protein [Amycolatopsis acidiphila]GHG67556.1 anti-anti-sigma factor [Amycolatopsis acidiphila]